MDMIVIAPNSDKTITNYAEAFISWRLGSIASALSFRQQKGVAPSGFQLDASFGERILVASVPASCLERQRWDSDKVAEMRERMLERIQALSPERLQNLSDYLNSLPDQPETPAS
jgi:hypothetical protein